MKIHKLTSNCCHFCLARRWLKQRRITRESKLLHWICSYLVRACVAAHESGVCERSLATQYFHIQSENIQGKQMFFIYCRYVTFFSRATTSYFFIYLMSGFNPFNIFSHQIGKNKHFFFDALQYSPRATWCLRFKTCGLCRWLTCCPRWPACGSTPTRRCCTARPPTSPSSVPWGNGTSKPFKVDKYSVAVFTNWLHIQ